MNKRHTIPLNIVLEVINRDQLTCQKCGKKGYFVYRYGKPAVVENPENIYIEKGKCCNSRKLISFNIDHINPISNGGENNIDNLQLLCRKCNRQKGNKIMGETWATG